jgi:hypothetical protein
MTDSTRGGTGPLATTTPVRRKSLRASEWRKSTRQRRCQPREAWFKNKQQNAKCKKKKKKKSKKQNKITKKKKQKQAQG